MIPKPKDLIQPRLDETALIWDNSDSKWIIAYRADFRRQKTFTFLSAVTFNAALTTYTSKIFHCAGYRDLLLLISLVVTGAPTDIVFNVEFSDDQANWFKYMVGPFGDLRYEDAAGDKTESLDCPVLAPYMRISVVATGTAGDATFLTTVKAIFNG